MNKYYLPYIIAIIFCILFGVYFLVTNQYIGGCLLIGVSLPLNIMWLIKEIKEGEEDE